METRVFKYCCMVYEINSFVDTKQGVPILSAYMNIYGSHINIPFYSYRWKLIIMSMVFLIHLVVEQGLFRTAQIVRLQI